MPKNTRKPVARAPARKLVQVATKRPANPPKDDTPLRIADALEAIAAHLAANAPAPVVPHSSAAAPAFACLPNGRFPKVPRATRAEPPLLRGLDRIRDI